MPPVTIYTTPFCGYCHAAKRLLGTRGIVFTEIDVSAEPHRRAELVQRAAGRRTVPQVFIGDTHVGGFTDMAALVQDGRLDRLLAAE